ncbi:CLUMA_CG012198, isoform A [Clunio marinus]|uniref:CLUMA_CG012198, isoform A n=1 Tax=Clunio marinus TaxID=568069 RepID=A0A1J1IE86_9DIPT|nr:CLUMA_CG012198, isoform A [Clunio marinus]
MVKCVVKYDNNPNGIYYSGQSLSGIIEFENEKTRNVRGVSLRIEGFAKCSWSESEGTGKNRRTVRYRGREDYINSFSYLIGSYDVTESVLTEGVHKFNFSCVLPQQLPTSFESHYGYIRYQIKVEVERPWKFDIKYCFGFTVIKILDLNYEPPAIRSPMKTETSKTFFLGLGSKPLFVAAEIPMSGFVSGQLIPVSVKINNESSTDVEATRVSLKKIIHYNSLTPRRRTKERIEKVAEVIHVGVPGKSKNNVTAMLKIPPVPPTNTAYCKVIQVSYEIRIKAKIGGIHRSPGLRFPITIGTVPLQNSIYTQPRLGWNAGAAAAAALPLPSTSNAQPSAPEFDALQPSAPFDLPPPSYQEAIGGSTKKDSNNGEALTEDQPFSPMYPVFNFSSQPQPQSQINIQPSNSELPPSYNASQENYQEKKGF